MTCVYTRGLRSSRDASSLRKGDLETPVVVRKGDLYDKGRGVLGTYHVMGAYSTAVIVTDVLLRRLCLPSVLVACKGAIASY